MSLCVRVLCFLVALGVLLPIMSGEWGYSNAWAVEITEGGDKMADQIANKYGFINRGLIGNLHNVYHFELPDGPRKSLPHLTIALQEEYVVGFVEQQQYRRMVPKPMERYNNRY